MGWELIDGDPAPGSPESIQRAINALTKVSTLASSARSTLDQSVGALGVDRWKGTAADAFRANVRALPPRLGAVVVSYQEASTALTVFKNVLESSQRDSSAALSGAQQATEDRRQAIVRRDQAQQQVDALRSQEEATARTLHTLRVQAAATADPTLQAGLQQRIWATRSAFDRLRADRGAAEATRDRHSAAVDAANQRFGASIAQAARIRARITDAVSVAVDLLKNAEADAHLPNRVERKVEELKEALVTYGPILIKSLKLGETLFEAAALLFPPGAGVFILCAVVCGGAAVVVSLGVGADQPGGLNTDTLLHLGVDALGVAASAVGLGTGVRLIQAAKWLTVASDAADIGLAVKEGGVEGGLRDAGGMLIGHYATKVTGAGVQKAIAFGNKSPKIGGVLNDISLNVRKSDSTVFSIPLVSDESSRQTQSLLAGGRYRPGEFLPGNTARLNPSIRDHATKVDLESGAPTEIVKQRLDAWADQPAPPPQEIDINLPMPAPRGAGGGW